MVDIINILFNAYTQILVSLLIGGFVAVSITKIFDIGPSFPRNLSRTLIVVLLIYVIILIIFYPRYSPPIYRMSPFFAYVDGMILMISLAILISSFIVISSYPVGSSDISSVSAVSLLGVLGSILISFSIDPVAIIVSWALLSIASYAIIALFKDPLSLDASARYAVVGVVASQFLLLGLGLLILFNFVVFSGVLSHGFIGQDVYRLILMLSISMLLVALGFKLGSAPFHFWLPDVYGRGSPYAIAGVAGFIKIGLVGFLLRFAIYGSGLGYISGFSGSGIDPGVFFYTVALLSVLSMLIGSITPLTQSSIQRILAFSSIAHIGFIFIGVAVLSIVPPNSTAYLFAFAGVLIHVLAYSISKSSMFVLVGFMRSVYGSSDLSLVSSVSTKPGSLKTSVIIHLANLIGVPPLPGFWGKLLLFLSATYSDPRLYLGFIPWLSLLGIVASIFSVFYYLNIIRAVSIEGGGSGGSREIRFIDRHDLFYPYIASLIVIALGILAPGIMVYLRLI